MAVLTSRCGVRTYHYELPTRIAVAFVTLQYDIDAGPGRIIVDEHCYMSFLRDVVEGTPAESVDG